MSFLNLALLGGAAAFLVPLVIHLLNRSRHQSIDWGAMHLLEAALQVNSRRFQWESVLLLMLRCLIPILFAIGLARPVLTSFRSSTAQGEASIVVMIDNSLSMLEPDDRQPEQTRFDRAVDEIRQLLGAQTRADLSVWSSGGGEPINVVDGSTFDNGLALRSLSKITAGAGPSEPTEIVESAAAQLGKMANPNKQLIIASDFQASQWSSLSLAQKERIRELLQSSAQPIQLSLLHFGSTTSDVTNNLSVELASESWSGQLEPVFVDDPVIITASVRNWSARQIQNAKVSFQVDQQAMASETVSLQPSSKQQVQFGCSFKTTGSHLFSVRLELPTESAGQLAGDDIAFGAIKVHEPIQVLIVDPESVNREDAGGKFLQLALSPMSSEAGLQVLLSPRLPPDDDLRRCNVLVMFGSAFDDNSAKKIVSFVQQGGGFLLVASEGMDIGRVNRLWLEQTKLLPAKFLERRKSSNDESLRIKKQNHQDSVLALFNSPEQGDLLSIQVQQCQPLEIQAAPELANVATLEVGEQDASTKSHALDTTTLLLEDQSVLLAKRSFGNGSVMQLGLSPDPKWSNFATRPVFVPFMQRLVMSLLGEGLQPPQQYLTGQTPSLSPKQLYSASASMLQVAGIKERWSSEGSQEVSLAWIEPNGQSSKISIDRIREATGTDAISAASGNNSPQIISLPMMRWPGVYRVGPSDSLNTAITPDSNGAAKELGLAIAAAAVPSHESDTKLMSKDQLDQLAKSLGATVVESASSFQAMQQVRRDGKEIWRPLVVVLLIFLFGEIFLARRVTRGASW